MPYTVSSYPQGTFCWSDVVSHDIDASKKFLVGVFGWNAVDMPTGQPGFDYTMFDIDGHYITGGSKMQPGMESVPSMWNSYISVDDVDAMTAKAQQLGATIVMPVMDVLDSGRMSAIKDPTGATVFLWQPKNHIGAGMVNTAGAMGWNELYTPDLAKAQDFFGKLFGWTFEADETGYVMIRNNGRLNGGMMAITSEMQGMPPMWMVYFTVADMDQTLAKTKELGGTVHMTREVGQGTIAMIADPAGASCMVIQMSVKPDEWTVVR